MGWQVTRSLAVSWFFGQAEHAQCLLLAEFMGKTCPAGHPLGILPYLVARGVHSGARGSAGKRLSPWPAAP